MYFIYSQKEETDMKLVIFLHDRVAVHSTYWKNMLQTTMVDNTKPNKELIAVHTDKQKEYQIEMQSRIIETNEIPKPEYSKNRKSESW